MNTLYFSRPARNSHRLCRPNVSRRATHAKSHDHRHLSRPDVLEHRLLLAIDLGEHEALFAPDTPEAYIAEFNLGHSGTGDG